MLHIYRIMKDQDKIQQLAAHKNFQKKNRKDLNQKFYFHNLENLNLNIDDQ